MDIELNEAKYLFYNKDYKSACEIFLKKTMFYECGMCFLLMNKINDAKKYFKKEKRNKFASSWGLIALDLMECKIKSLPTYLQIRAFYEVYIELLIDNNLIEYAQNMINMYPALVKFNAEVYKFISRALYAQGYLTLSVDFAKKTEENGFFDPEALYIEAEIYFREGKYSDSFDTIKKILDIIPEYYPAKRLKEELMNSI